MRILQLLVLFSQQIKLIMHRSLEDKLFNILDSLICGLFTAPIQNEKHKLSLV